MRNRRIIVSLIAIGVVALSAGTVAAAAVVNGSEPSEPRFASAAQRRPGAAEAPAAAPQDAAAPSAATTNPTTTAAPAPTADTIVAPASIAYLREQYGVSEAEARRRLALQQSSTALERELAAAYPDEYAGMWLDQEAGGVLRVAATQPERLAPALAKSLDAAHVSPVRVARSLRQLDAAADRARTALRGTPGVAVAVDPVTNQVVVSTEQQVDQADPRLAAALSTAGAAGRLHRRPVDAGVPKACDPIYCAQAPMRAGIRLDVPRDDKSVGGCTTGWNLRSRTTGEYFVLTAGHCVLNPLTHSRVDDTWHQFLGPKVPVTVEHPNATTRGLLGENVKGNPGSTAAYDYAIMPYQPGARDLWDVTREMVRAGKVPGINFWCPAGTSGCTSRDIAISGVIPLASVKRGWIVCATGGGYTPKAGETYVDSGAGAGYVPGTHCGQVKDVTALITVQICARPGDSGGPLFTEADGGALGILKYGDSRSGKCVAGDTEVNHYSPLASILTRVNSRTSLKLELSPTGPLPLPAPRRP